MVHIPKQLTPVYRLPPLLVIPVLGTELLALTSIRLRYPVRMG